MTIILGIFLPMVLFIITLPLKSLLYLYQREAKKREGGSFSTEKDLIRRGVNTTKKTVKNTKRAVKITAKTTKAVAKLSIRVIKLTIKLIRAIIALIRLVIQLVMFLVSLGFVGLLVIFVVLVVALVSCVLFVDGTKLGTTSGGTQVSSSSDGLKKEDTKVSASVEKIAQMSDAECWKLVSDNRFSSKTEVYNAIDNNYESEKAFWEGMMTEIEVPVWSWTDNTYKDKVEGTIKIQINKNLAEYWKSFFTDLHKCSEKYVISSITYGFSWRDKVGGAKGYSGHSFGTVVDINYETTGMHQKEAPFNTDVGLTEPTKSMTCAYNSSWFKLAVKYGIDWGGNWSSGSLDGMHFSLLGDNSKDNRNFTPKTPGQSPK